MNKWVLEKKLTQELSEIIKEQLSNVLVNVDGNEIDIQEMSVNDYDNLFEKNKVDNYFENDLSSKVSLIVKHLNNAL